MKKKVASSLAFLKNDRSVRVFSIFLVLTTIIWFLIELSKTYSSTAYIKIDYKNLSNTQILQEAPLDRIEVALRSSGFNLMSYQLFSKKVTLDLTDAIYSRGDRHFVLLNNHQLEIGSQLSSGTELLRFNRDTIFFELGATVSKKVPVLLALDISYKPGYNLMSDIEMQPDSVLITGPEKYIDTIQLLRTKSIQLTDVYENVNQAISIQTNQEVTAISYGALGVNVTAVVEKITEGKLTIPVHIINVPSEISVTTFPKNIDIVFQVGLSNFKEINEKSFEIVFDYNTYLKDPSLVYLLPIVRSKSSLVRSVEVKPGKVEFLIQKK
ncbi:MAG: hypothetical protein COB98_01250 [Flavobacteriaceae bacterium]|nr:MAG: hypothetical protein COB98_01250 [Flavobacteriaceae bacterium]